MEFKQTTVNKCINKTCYKMIKKETKLKSLIGQLNVQLISLKYLHAVGMKGEVCCTLKVKG